MFDSIWFAVFVVVSIVVALVFLAIMAFRTPAAAPAAPPAGTTAPTTPMGFWEKMSVFGSIALVVMIALLFIPTQWHKASARERGEVKASDGAGITGPVGMKGVVVKGANGEIYLATGSDSQSVLHQAEEAKKVFGGNSSSGAPGSWIEN